MFGPTLIMGIIAAVLVGAGYFHGRQHMEGLSEAARMLIEILPLLIFAFITAGMAQTLLPEKALSAWVGEESGFKGIMLGSFAGALTPGGPYVSLPIVAGLYKAGVGIAPLVAYLTGWSLWAVSRLPLEVGILGWRLTIIRLASVLIFPPIAGLLAKIIKNFL